MTLQNSADPVSDERRVDRLLLKTFASRHLMAETSAAEIAAELRARLAEKDRVRMVFAAAPSQADVLAALAAAPDIDWTRVIAFHMDEYVGLPENAPERFAKWLDRNIFDLVPFGAVNHILPGADPEATAREYAEMLNEAPIDVIQLGIGVNGHIAFNDPPVADFDDALDVKVVTLDQVCRQQQVDDECFAELSEVPSQAITLTIPRLMRGERLFCMVPTEAKREAVKAALYGPIATSCPASILRRHEACTLYLDPEANPDA